MHRVSAYATFLVVITSLAFSAGHASTPPDPMTVKGWKKAKWGMSEKEILKAVKGARAVNVKREMSTSFHPTLYVFARIDTLLISANPFRIDFLADSATQTLAAVEQTNLNEITDTATVSLAFNTLAAMLKKDLGPPTSKGDNLPKARWWLWNYPHTKIYLAAVAVKNSSKTRISISYHINAAE